MNFIPLLMSTSILKINADFYDFENDVKTSFLEKLAAQLIEKVDDLGVDFAKKVESYGSKAKAAFEDFQDFQNNDKVIESDLSNFDYEASSSNDESSILFDSFLADKKSFKTNQEIVELLCKFRNGTHFCEAPLFTIKSQGNFVKFTDATLKIASTDRAINVKVNKNQLKNLGKYLYTSILPSTILQDNLLDFEIAGYSEDRIKAAIAVSYITKIDQKSRSKRSIKDQKVQKCSKNNGRQGCGLCSVGELSSAEITAVLRKNSKFQSADLKVVSNGIEANVCYSDRSCSLKTFNNGSWREFS